jgi:hypothetical protein
VRKHIGVKPSLVAFVFALIEVGQFTGNNGLERAVERFNVTEELFAYLGNIVLGMKKIASFFDLFLNARNVFIKFIGNYLVLHIYYLLTNWFQFGFKFNHAQNKAFRYAIFANNNMFTLAIKGGIARFVQKTVVFFKQFFFFSDMLIYFFNFPFPNLLFACYTVVNEAFAVCLKGDDLSI